MDITATITGIEYQICLLEGLQKIDFNDFDINDCPSSCLIINEKGVVAISKWVSHKRKCKKNHSYPNCER